MQSRKWGAFIQGGRVLSENTLSFGWRVGCLALKIVKFKKYKTKLGIFQPFWRLFDENKGWSTIVSCENLQAPQYF